MSDGITQGVISRLSQLSALNKVISSSSVSQYKGKQVDAGTVAQELDVRAVVMGNMASQGENLRIYVELVDAENNSTLWSENYTRLRSQLYEMEEIVSKEIADALGVSLTGRETERLSMRYTDNAEAYELYQKGLFFLEQRSLDGLRTALDYFGQALEIDPDYAQAHSGLAQVFNRIAIQIYGVDETTPQEEARREARTSALRAISLDNTLAEAQQTLGQVYFHERNWEEAESQYKKAIAINPNLVSARLAFALLLWTLGRNDEAIQQAELATEIDPTFVRAHRYLGQAYFYAREYPLAIQKLTEALKMGSGIAGLLLWEAYWVTGEPDLARGVVDNFPAIPGLQKRYWYSILDGNNAEAGRILDEIGQNIIPSIYLALSAYSGDKERFFRAATILFEWGDASLAQGLPSPVFDPFRDDPRFQDLMRRMNLEP